MLAVRFAACLIASAFAARSASVSVGFVPAGAGAAFGVSTEYFPSFDITTRSPGTVFSRLSENTSSLTPGGIVLGAKPPVPAFNAVVTAFEMPACTPDRRPPAVMAGFVEAGAGAAFAGAAGAFAAAGFVGTAIAGASVAPFEVVPLAVGRFASLLICTAFSGASAFGAASGTRVASRKLPV